MKIVDLSCRNAVKKHSHINDEMAIIFHLGNCRLSIVNCQFLMLLTLRVLDPRPPTPTLFFRTNVV